MPESFALCPDTASDLDGNEQNDSLYQCVWTDGKRITTMVFMAWLAIVFVLWCACQRRKLPMIRTAVMSGSAFYVILCVLPLERIVTAINGIFFTDHTAPCGILLTETKITTLFINGLL